MKILLCTVIGFNFISFALAYLASFSGDSFIFQSFSSSPQDTTSVSLRFQTSTLDGLLFLALGHYQYLLIELNNGRIEVKVDLGYGEEILSTDEEKSLNNLIWHDFKVIRSGSNIKLVLNGKDVTSDQIPVPSAKKPKFDTSFGVFVGGLGGNLTLPKGIQPSKFYRGCLLNAEINGHDLLTPLLPIPNKRILYNVQPGCPKIFRSTRSEPINFDSASSYVALRRWTTQDEGTFECMLKTSGSTGMILYNSGRGRGEFIGLEMVDGVIGASVNKGGGVVALLTTRPINDGNWHSIRFSFSPSYLDIRVDGNQTKAFVEQTKSQLPGGVIDIQHHNLDLAGHLYIGGVPVNMLKKRALPHSLASLGIKEGGGFPGCMKNMRVNHRRKGFSDFLISHKISVGCKKSSEFSNPYLEAADNYKEANAIVSKLFVSFEKEMAKKELNRKKNPSVTTTTSTTQSTTLAPNFELPSMKVVTSPLIVTEGEIANISSQQLLISDPGGWSLLDPSELEIPVTHQPSHGILVKHSDCDSEDELISFTMMDLLSQSIFYCHDGSETENDSFQLNILWNLENKDSETKIRISELVDHSYFVDKSVYLNNATTYTLPIAISPFNDPPELHIPMNYVFHPIKNTATLLPASVLQATDPDSLPRQIHYLIMGRTDSSSYHVENQNSSGRPVVSFTQEDVDLGRMTFVHKGVVDNARLILRISNPRTEMMHTSPTAPSSTAVLRIAAIPLEIAVSVNEIKLPERSTFILSQEYLFSTTNADAGSVKLIYKIKEKPTLGIIEVRRNPQEVRAEMADWVESSSFTESQISNGRVRYKNLNITENVTDLERDSFQFTVSGAGVESPPHTLAVTVQKVDVKLILSSISLVNGTQEQTLIPGLFNIQITHILPESSQIELRLEKKLKFSALFDNENDIAITKGQTFTLEQVELGQVSIQVEEDFSAESFTDDLQLVAIVDKIYVSDFAHMNVSYVADLTRIQLLNFGLDLNEGDERLITREQLWAYLPSSPVTERFQNFKYTVTCGPQHGLLHLKKSAGKLRKSELGASLDHTQSLSEFTSMDVKLKKLYYRHDDSEMTSDSFCLHIAPVIKRELPPSLASLRISHINTTFHINVKLVNDEKPTRAVDRVFEIARDNERLLTRDDLWYHDADTDFDDCDLVYSRRDIDNGELLNGTSNRKEKIYNFTQREIESGEVIFRHKGLDQGTFKFWVKDGKHDVAGQLVISATEPYVRIVNSSQLWAVKGKETAITSQNLWTVNNIKALKEDLIYRITKEPGHGVLIINKTTDGMSDSTADVFTQQHIFNGTLLYKHDGSTRKADNFEFEVTAGNQKTQGVLPIRVFLESQLKPPAVERNQTVQVNEGKRIQIKKQDLRILHSDSKANEIKMIIRQAPKMGFLQLLSNAEKTELKDGPVKEFSQFDINHGLLWYVHNGSFSYTWDDFTNEVLLDHFVFDVTNGILNVSGLQMNLDIVPQMIPLRVNNFTLLEGGTEEITKDIFHVLGPHYDKSNVEIRVLVPPMNGRLEFSRGKGVALENFTLDTAETLNYVHDGSDTLQDMYTLQAFTKDGRTQSKVCTTYITIIPDNDEWPEIVNNTGMTMWANSVTEITSVELAAVDADNEPEELKYEIQSPSNGWVSLRDKPHVHVLNFTQQDLNIGNILFHHQGSGTGGFTFQVSDGLNSDIKRIFVVTAKPLVLSVRKNTGTQMYPDTEITITRDILSYMTNDDELGSRIISYKIIRQPRLGTVVKLTNSSGTQAEEIPEKIHRNSQETVEMFTQQDIDDGLLMFKQDTGISHWLEMDSITLNISSPPADDVFAVKFMINITYDMYGTVGKSSPISVNKGLELDEGGQFVITTDVLDASNIFKKLPLNADRETFQLQYAITNHPKHGNISSSEINNISYFTHTELQQGKVVYVHDNSETTEDIFELDMFIVDGNITDRAEMSKMVSGTLFHDRVNVAVNPVNDNPPVLMTKGKYLEVVDGFDTPILSRHLSFTDQDDPPENVQFTVMRQLTRGRLYSVEGVSNLLTPISSFTQASINNGGVIYSPLENKAGPGDGMEDLLYYGVTDSAQHIVYNMLQIKIVPVYLNFEPMKIQMTQGSYSAILNTSLLVVSSNGNLSMISFAVTQPAKSGLVIVNKKQSSAFTYDELLEGKVEFKMISNTISKDQLNITATYREYVSTNLTVSSLLEIVVVPLVAKGSLQVSCNGLTRLKMSSLDATSLWRQTRSMPVYDVVHPPHCGFIMKVFPQKEKRKNVEEREDPTSSFKQVQKREVTHNSNGLQKVDRFTHRDLLLGYIFLFMPNISVSDEQPVQDNVTLRLTVEDGSVQPSVFNFDFDIVRTASEDYSSFFEQFNIEVAEFPTEEYLENLTRAISGKSEMNENDVEDNDEPSTPADVMSEEVEPSEAGTNVPWMIPVAVVIGILIVLIICITVIYLIHRNRNKDGKANGGSGAGYHRGKRKRTSRSEGETHSSDYDGGSMDPVQVPHVTHSDEGDNNFSGELLRSPACPGVTVKILNTRTNQRVPDSIQPSIYSGEDRQSLSVMSSSVPFNSTVGVQSYRDDGYPSTIYTPSTVYHYDDTNSIDLVDGTEAEYYAANRASYGSQHRLYHARSAKLIDPDVLALYSSDESIPSMIDEKYASPYPGSVPSGLNRSHSQPGRAQVGLGGSQSTASLSKAGATPGLSLLAGASKEVNQYWI